MGRNYEALGEYGAAREEYIRAYYMVPCRLYPLVRLMRMEIALGNDGDEGLRKDVHSWQAIFFGLQTFNCPSDVRDTPVDCDGETAPTVFCL